MFFEDRVVLGDLTVHYAYLRKLQSIGNVLHVGYVVADGTAVEQYFRYDKLLASKAIKELQSAVARAHDYAANVPQATVEAAAGLIDDEPAVASTRESADGRMLVEIRDPDVLFPLVCPHCSREADMVGILYASRGLGERGAWVVPTCESHPNVSTSISLTKWSALKSGFEFSFANHDYAELFRKLNQGEAENESGQSTRLAWDLERGTTFVVFPYVISAITVTVQSTSHVRKIEHGTNGAIVALPFIILTALVGWWSLAGPILSIRAIRTDLGGGINLNDSVSSLINGVRAKAQMV